MEARKVESMENMTQIGFQKFPVVRKLKKLKTLKQATAANHFQRFSQKMLTKSVMAVAKTRLVLVAPLIVL